ncbi:MAG: hypothetical protein K0Q79_1730 [Flavipsychrobacter sp.]|jgi:hypothetical protein|nr:hypothetical protein [Flavipsychrobacter sp.]
MNTKLLLSLCLTAITVTSYAQVPTLTSANVAPSVHDTFITVVAEESLVTSTGAIGASAYWDFSGLVKKDIADSVSVGYVSWATDAPGYVSGSGATHAVVTPTPPVSNFYIVSPAKLSQTGLYKSMTEFAAYSDPVDVLQFPFTYGGTFTDAYAGVIGFLGTTATEAGTIQTTADGWGTLVLPPAPPSTTNRTFTGTLRVYSYQLFRDSANIFGTPIVQTDTIRSYTWYQPGYHSALLTITTVSGPMLYQRVVSYARKQTANHAAVPELSGVDATLKVYPNPAKSCLYISFSAPLNERARISLLDVLGREVSVISDGEVNGDVSATCNTSSLPKGQYFVRVQSAAGSVTRAVEIQ